MSRPVMHSTYVDLLVAGLRDRGDALAAALSRSGVDPTVLEEPRARVTPHEFGRLSTAIALVTRDEQLGLGSGRVRPGTFATLCDVLALTRSLGEALELGARFYRSVTSDFRLTINRTGSNARIRISSAPATDDRKYMLHCLVVFYTYGLACWLTGRRIPLSRLDFAFEERPGTAYASGVFRSPVVRYDRGRTDLIFDAGWLDRPVLSDDTRVADLIARLPEPLLLGYRDETAIAEQIRVVLRRHLADPPSLAEAAEIVLMSEHSLRRHLRAEGHTYQELKDEVRRAAACDLLLSSAMPIEQVAIKLGFAELSSFHRAFGRWTGQTPGSYRADAPR